MRRDFEAKLGSKLKNIFINEAPVPLSLLAVFLQPPFFHQSLPPPFSFVKLSGVRAASFSSLI